MPCANFRLGQEIAAGEDSGAGLSPPVPAQQSPSLSARMSLSWQLDLFKSCEIEFMAETDDIQRRWRDLAEQLGLPPEPADKPAKPATPRAVTEGRPVAATPRRLQEQPSAKPPEVPEEPVEAAAEDAAVPVTAAAPEIEERRPARGRRRGRRSGSRSSDSAAGEREEAESAADAPPDAEAGTDAEEGEATMRERSPRGRGRGRHKKAEREETEAPAAVDDVEEGEPEEAPEPATDNDEDDDGDDMSGWDIPSWQELIDSLYRPDR